jgi:hypothetical protein
MLEADRHAISDVLIDYCRFLDAMDLEAIARLFTHDCIVDYGEHELLRSNGAEALALSLQRMWRWARTSHHLSNIRIWFDGPKAAHSVSYVFAWHERPDGSMATILGQYHDAFELTGSSWLISRRKMFCNGNDAGFTVPIHPFERREPPPGWTPPRIDGRQK